MALVEDVKPPTMWGRGWRVVGIGGRSLTMRFPGDGSVRTEDDAEIVGDVRAGNLVRWIVDWESESSNPASGPWRRRVTVERMP